MYPNLAQLVILDQIYSRNALSYCEALYLHFINEMPFYPILEKTSKLLIPQDVKKLDLLVHRESLRILVEVIDYHYRLH
jgi:hypothetical protein